MCTCESYTKILSTFEPLKPKFTNIVFTCYLPIKRQSINCNSQFCHVMLFCNFLTFYPKRFIKRPFSNIFQNFPTFSNIFQHFARKDLSKGHNNLFFYHDNLLLFYHNNLFLFSNILLAKIYQKPITIYYSHDGQ